MNCRNNKWGHYFIDGVCKDCGDPQITLGRISKPKRENINKHLHSRIHELADKFYQYYKEDGIKFMKFWSLVSARGDAWAGSQLESMREWKGAGKYPIKFLIGKKKK